jgi:hypothetical protein
MCQPVLAGHGGPGGAPPQVICWSSRDVLVRSSWSRFGPTFGLWTGMRSSLFGPDVDVAEPYDRTLGP